MKSIRALFVLTSLVLGGVMTYANCGSCESADHAEKEKPKCEAKCEKPCDKSQECAASDKAKCDKEKMTCCEEAAKAGKPCEKCNPPESAEKK